MKDSDWSFSLRKFDPTAFEDSDSEDDNANHDKRVLPSSPSQAAQSFDLSTREETVTYKPNPFSIAKINAACRSRSAKDPEDTPVSKLKLTAPVRPVATKQVQGKKNNLANMIHSSKGRSNVSRASCAMTGDSRAITVLPRQGAIVQRRSPEPEVLIVKPKQEESGECTSLTGVSSTFDPSSVPSSAARPPPPLKALSAPSSQITQHRQMRLDKEVSLPALVHPHIASQKAHQAGIYDNSNVYASASKANFGAQKRQLVPPYSYSSPPRPPSSSWHDALEIRPRAFTPSFKREAFPEPALDMKPLSSMPLRPSAFSSPARYPEEERTFAHVPSTGWQAPRKGITQPSPLRPSSLYTPQQSAHKFALKSEAENQPPLRFFQETNKGSEPSSRNSLAKPPEYEEDLPPLAPFPEPHRRTPPRFSKTMPGALTIPSPPKKRKRNVDAYAFGRPDEDEEWSTIAASKKKKIDNAISSSTRTTGSFHIPGLINTSTEGRKSGMSATSQRRVITFLPPPLPSNDAPSVSRLPLSSSHDIKSEFDEHMQSEPGALDYPTPDKPRASNGPRLRHLTEQSQAIEIQGAFPRKAEYDCDRLPSPPTSDDRMLEGSAIQVSDLQERYHRHRNRVRA